jgi:D-alanine-D-alanine ligase
MSNQRFSLLILHEKISSNARSDELDTLVQVEQICSAMQAKGWQVETRATGLNLEATHAAISSLNPDCIFNLVESLAGVGQLVHFIPSLLATLNCAYTGVNADAMYLSSQKCLAKKIMHLNNIATADSFGRDDLMPITDGQWIVKSLWEHASFGMDDACVVTGAEAALARIDYCKQQHGGEWFAERYLQGREFNVSVIEVDGQPKILPVAEIQFAHYPRGKPKIVSYAAKWHEQTFEYQATQRVFPILSAAETSEINTLVLRCWQAFQLSSYARVDIRCDETGKPWVLEINANPCLTQDAGFAAACHQAGMSYPQVVETIIKESMSSWAKGLQSDAPMPPSSLAPQAA